MPNAKSCLTQQRKGSICSFFPPRPSLPDSDPHAGAKLRLPLGRTLGFKYDRLFSAGLAALAIYFSGAGCALAAPPANNNFASRINLGSVAFSSNGGTTVGANCEGNERDATGSLAPAASPSVWYQWTSQGNGYLDVSVSSSAFSPEVCVFTTQAASR